MENRTYKYDTDDYEDDDIDGSSDYVSDSNQVYHRPTDLNTISFKVETKIENGLTLSWENVNVYLPAKQRGILKCFEKQYVGKEHIVENVEGIARPGELLAIMGASGAGKTTLLNVLNFRTRGKLRITGDVKVNGISVKSALQLASISGFVQQDDLFIGTLTVKEHLRFQAMLRMDKGTSYENRMRRIEEVLLDLNLKKCENTLIGVPSKNIKGISGGEKRRLGFATEVLTNPSLLFCDEPTSGLDSFMALSIVETMKRLADQGKTIICTIHQPSSEIFEMFDRLCLLAEGRLAYIGDREKAYDFFFSQGFICPPNYNPADFYIQKLAIVPANRQECLQNVKSICDNFNKTVYMEDLQQELTEVTDTNKNKECAFNRRQNESVYNESFLVQLKWLTWREFLASSRDPTLTKIQFLQVTIMALFFGFVFFRQKTSQDSVQNINGALALLIENNTFQNVFAVIATFYPEMPLFLREHYIGMFRVFPYFLSKVLSQLPTFLLLPIISTTIFYWMVDFNVEAVKFLICCLTIILIANNAAAFGSMISAFSPSISVALSISSPIIVPLLTFSGFYLNNDAVPVYFIWVKYVSWLSYGYEVLLVNQWSDVAQIDCPINNVTKCRYQNGDDVLRVFSMDKSNFNWDLIAMAALYFGLRLITYLGLLRRSYVNK